MVREAGPRGRREITGLSLSGLLDAGDGNNTITLKAASAGGLSVAVYNACVRAGLGDDIIRILAQSTKCGKAVGLEKGTLDLGEGNNKLDVVAQSVSCDAKGIYDSKIKTGAGNDFVRLEHIGTAGNLNFTQSGAKPVLDGGSNDAVVHAGADHGFSSLGDILSLEHNYADAGMLSKLTSQATVKNFEALLVDLTDGQADYGFNLDSLLNAVDYLSCRGNAGMSLMVKGDAGLDSVDAHGRLDNAVTHTDVSVEGFTETFTHYQVEYDHQLFNLYLQTGVSVA